MKNAIKFFFEFLKSPRQIGAILPSSRWLAREMVSEIFKGTKRRLILEVGPGTGVFTDEILRVMSANDELHIVEYDQNFYQNLCQKYQGIPQIKIFHGCIVEYEPLEKYDFIISGLPLNAFEPEFVDAVFEKFLGIANEGAKISYFEYFFGSLVRKQVARLKKEFYAQYKLRKAKTFRNFPPAKILHHQL